MYVYVHVYVYVYMFSHINVCVCVCEQKSTSAFSSFNSDLSDRISSKIAFFSYGTCDVWVSKCIYIYIYIYICVCVCVCVCVYIWLHEITSSIDERQTLSLAMTRCNSFSLSIRKSSRRVCMSMYAYVWACMSTWKYVWGCMSIYIWKHMYACFVYDNANLYHWLNR